MEARNGFDLRALLMATGTPFTVHTYDPHGTIFMQGDTATGVHYIETGIVRLVVTAPSGKEAISGVLMASAFIGESALRGERTYRQTAIAMAPTTIIQLPVAAMQQLLARDATVRDHFIGYLLAQHTRLESDLTDQIMNASEQRLARALVRLSGCGSDPARRTLPPISQEHLAKMIGTTRSRVNAFMGKFRKLGFVETTDGVVLVNPSLRHLAISAEGRRELA